MKTQLIQRLEVLHRTYTWREIASFLSKSMEDIPFDAAFIKAHEITDVVDCIAEINFQEGYQSACLSRQEPDSPGIPTKRTERDAIIKVLTDENIREDARQQARTSASLKRYIRKL